MRRFSLLVFLSAVCSTATIAQSFVFDDAGTSSDFSYHKDGSNIICFYKTWNSDKNFSHYRTVVLNSGLELTDTVNYRMPGECSNLVSGENDQYGYHLFHTRQGEKESITFLITDKYGKVLREYEKSAEEFTQILGKKVKLAQLGFKTIPTTGNDAGTLLLLPAYFTKSGSLRWVSPMIALNILDGTLKWKFGEQPLQRPVAINGRIVDMHEGNSGYPEIHTYAIEDGKPVSAFRVSPPDRNRAISLFEVNSDEIIVGGSDAIGKSDKHVRFFLTRFDFSGKRIFDKVDTVERLPGSRIQMADGIFMPDGNIVLIGESYRIDASALVAGTALAVATVLLGSPVIVGPRGNVNRIVQTVVSAKISPAGDVTEFHSFPVDPRKTFSTLIKDDRQVFLRNQNQLLWYNLDDLRTAPRKFTKLTANADVFTLYGNLIGVRRDDLKREIILSVITGDAPASGK